VGVRVWWGGGGGGGVGGSLGGGGGGSASIQINSSKSRINRFSVLLSKLNTFCIYGYQL